MPPPPLHPELLARLRALGLSPDEPPAADAWPDLLQGLSQALAHAEATALEDLPATPMITADGERTHARFIANMSHELRTPLNAIVGYSQMLLEELPGSDRAHLAADVHKVERSARRLSRMIDDILDLSRIDAGHLQLHREWIDLPALLDEATDAAQTRVREHHNTLRVEVDRSGLGPVLADRKRLRQCIDNLLSNAAKFTEHGRIDVRARRVGGWVEVTVSDTGPGMSLDRQHAIFGEFVQGDETRRQGGAGLGLPLTRRMTELMGGALSVDSTPGVGSRFTLTLPHLAATPGPTSRRGAATPDGAATSDRVVVIIDDDPDVLELCDRILAREGWRVVGATTGARGLQLTRQLRPSLVLLDLVLPGASGWEVLAALRADPSLVSVPVVILSTVDERPRALSSGAAGYLVKPVDRASLVHTVATHAQVTPA